MICDGKLIINRSLIMDPIEFEAYDLMSFEWNVSCRFLN